MALLVNEIFYSIQGESSYAGRPCVFVRLTGCNLRCSYCDTRYAYEDGCKMAIDEVVSAVMRIRCPLVEVTGGEPLIQKETPVLIQKLLDRNCQVLLETNGSWDIGIINERCVRIVDIKCPSSGEHNQNTWENMNRLTAQDEVKFVMADRADYEYAKNVVKYLRQMQVKTEILHFSPVFGQLDPRELASWMLEDRVTARLQLQLHKIIWDPDQRGI